MNLPELLLYLTIHYNALVRHAASNLGLTTSQAFHLISIPHNGISMSHLSRKLGLDTSTLTRNIQKLEKIELVERITDLYDKRVLKVLLTPVGREVVEEIDEMLLQKNHIIVEKIDLDERENILNILERLVWAMDCLREE